MKVYTKTGDKKKTSLIGDVRLEKSNQRVDCYGTCDEALAYIGLTYNYVDDEKLQNQLKEIMKIFFYLNQDLANPNQAIPFAISEEQVSLIEAYIDDLSTNLPPLTKFILPISCCAASYANVTRTLVRRAERKIVNLSLDEEINVNILPLINRLSDYFFILGRYLNYICDFEDVEMIF